MKWIYVWLLAIVNFLLQSTVFETLRINGVAVNTSLILVVFMGLIFTNRDALTAAVISGLLQDIFYGWSIGVNVFIYIALAILIDMIDESVFKDKSMTPFILIFGSTIIYHMMYMGFMFILQVPMDVKALVVKIPIELAMNLAFGLLLYRQVIRRFIGYELR